MSCAGYGFLPKSAAFFRFSSARTPSCIRKSAPKTHVSARVFVLHSKQVGKQRIRRTGRGAQGADFILRPFAATKSAPKFPSMRCCVSLLFVMFPAAVFFIILRWLCFSRIFLSGEIRCALGNPSAVRNASCAVISLRPVCGSALSNTALFHIVKLLREAS